MVEKRFKKMDTIIDPFPIWDTVEEKGYNCTDTLDLLVGLLNMLHNRLIQSSEELCKKQIEIDRLKLKINELQQKIDILCEDNDYGR